MTKSSERKERRAQTGEKLDKIADTLTLSLNAVPILKDEVKKLNLKNQQLKDKINDYIKAVEQLTHKNTDKNLQIIKYTETIKTINLDLVESAKKIANLTSEKNDLEKKLQESTEHSEVLSHEKFQQKSLLERITEENNQVTQEKITLLEHNAELKNRLNQLEQDIDAEKEANQQKLEQIEILTAQTQQLEDESKKLTDEKNNYLRIINERKKDLDDLNILLENRDTELKKADEQKLILQQTASDLQLQIKAREEQHTKNMKIVRDLEEKNRQLTNDLEEKISKEHDLTTEYQAFKTEKTQELEHFKHALSETTGLYQQKTADVDKRDSEIDRLKQQIESLKQIINENVSELEETDLLFDKVDRVADILLQTQESMQDFNPDQSALYDSINQTPNRISTADRTPISVSKLLASGIGGVFTPGASVADEFALLDNQITGLQTPKRNLLDEINAAEKSEALSPKVPNSPDNFSFRNYVRGENMDKSPPLSPSSSWTARRSAEKSSPYGKGVTPSGGQ